MGDAKMGMVGCFDAKELGTNWELSDFLTQRCFIKKY